MQISDRAQRIVASQTIALDSKAKALKASGVNVINLTAGELDLPPHKEVIKANQAAAETEHRYGPVAGLPDLREAISRYLDDRYGCNYNANQIVVTNGAKQALFEVCQAVINPGDEVVVLQPGWVSYSAQIELSGGVVVAVDTDANNQPDVQAIAAAITDATVAIMVNSPNNPTGAVYSQQALQAIADLAEERDLLLISDEIYSELLYHDAVHYSLGTIAPDRTVVINGVSKSSAITGWRVGYLAGPQDIVDAITRMQSHVTGNVNIVAQHAAITALKTLRETSGLYVAELEKRQQAVAEILGGSIQSMQGAFYAWLQLPEDVSAIDFAETLLAEKFVAVVPGDFFGKPGFIRISYARPLSEVSEAAQRIADHIAS